MSDRPVEFDLIVYGASGFTGALVVEYLAHRYGASQELKWAMAGRDPTKLAATRERLGLPATIELIKIRGRRRRFASTDGRAHSVRDLDGGSLPEIRIETDWVCASSGVDYVDLWEKYPGCAR